MDGSGLLKRPRGGTKTSYDRVAVRARNEGRLSFHVSHLLYPMLRMTEATTEHRHTNRLVHETSPYLLQHAHNPVDWYPWGEQALAAATEQDRLILPHLHPSG